MAKKKLDKATLLEVIDALRQYDHAFLNTEGAHKMSIPFGFRATTFRHFADPPGTFKGLTLKGGAKSAFGVDAQHLAIQICDHVGVKYMSKFGRGSQLRVCCDALEEWAKAL